MVVSIISEWFLEAANHTCGSYDPSVNEMELAGLSPVPSEKVWCGSLGSSVLLLEIVRL